MLLEAQPARSPQVAISQGPRAALTLGGAITVPDDRLPSAWFTGVVLAGGEPVSQASVLVSATGSDTGFPFWSEADGSFALGPLAPGEYEVRVAAGGTTTKPLGVFTAVRGSEVELGDAHLLPAASLVLRIEGRPAEGGSVSIDVVRLEAAGAPTVVFRGNLHGAELRMESLSPGDYLATAWDRGGELASGPFRAEAGELVRISLDLGTAD
jgi:hypothetical protein